MAQYYSDPSREEDPHALPDLEVFYVSAREFAEASAETWMAEQLADHDYSPTACCDSAGWYYWYCMPGCLPDSEPNGPFATEELALADARENS